jgi:hypothetical protein
MKQPDDTALIATLVDELAPVRPMRLWEAVLACTVAAAATLILATLWLGVRDDLFGGHLGPFYLLSLGVTAILGMAASAAVIQLARPQIGSRPTGWAWVAAMAALVPLAGVLTQAGIYADTGRVLPHNGGAHCLYNGIALGVLVGAALTLWLRRGAPTSPARAGLLTGLAAGSMGLFAVALACPYNDIGHIGIWHGFGVIGSAIIGRLVVPPLVRW